jgi:phage/plasmid-like protein (TIGR03299 family)
MIDESTGLAAIAYAGGTPWHKLGRRMTEEQRRSLELAMQAAGLNWTVDATPLQYLRPCGPGSNNGFATVPDAAGIIRQDTGAYLATVGKGYTPIQNREAFDVLAPLVENHGCTIEVMASLDSGRRTFALLKMPDATITPATGDDVRGYVLVTNAHDGSSAVRAQLTPIRVVCQNTLTLSQATKHSTAAVVRHTKSAPDRLKQAAEIVERMQQALAKTGETYAELAARAMNAKELAAYIETVIPAPAADVAANTISEVIKARREAIADLIFHGHHVPDHITNSTYGISSAWRAYNAVTEYFDHIRATEAKSSSARATAYDSALFGGNAAIKARALNVLVAA